MTERAEIERLLQKTGRTLEGLPDDYGDEKLKTWRSFRDGKFGHIKSFEMANKILHQSDVIELLIGALQNSEPVVRCKDCTWFNHGYCMSFDDDVMPNGFCSRGHVET